MNKVPTVLPSVVGIAAHWPGTMPCGMTPWTAYWYAWQRARQLAAASKPHFDPQWN